MKTPQDTQGMSLIGQTIFSLMFLIRLRIHPRGAVHTLPPTLDTKEILTMFRKLSLQRSFYGALALLILSSASIATAQVTGSGSQNRVTKWTANGANGTTIGDSAIIETGGNVGIGTPTPGATLDVVGNINTTTQYNIGGRRILSTPTGQNTFVGINTGQSITINSVNNSFFGMRAGEVNTGNNNSFFGTVSALRNTTGSNNSFFGIVTGNANISGSDNAFFGYYAGALNTVSDNSFFGSQAGATNSTGARNAFFGRAAGLANTTSGDNSFFGFRAGAANTGGTNINDGSSNSFFGSQAGESNTSGSYNSFFGLNAGRANLTGFFNSFFGVSAGGANTSGIYNSFFGNNAGQVNTRGSRNSFFGISAGSANTEGGDNSFFGRNAGDTNTDGSDNTIIGANADVGSRELRFATAIGSNAVVSTSNTIALGRANGSDTVRVPGILVIRTLGVGGGTSLCRNVANQVTNCGLSSLRYKRDVAPFAGGLNLVRQLRPITFRWKTDDTPDVGFGAEDVARVAPLFVTHNAAGEVEGVKYDRLGVVLIKAVQEQQDQIEEQKKQLQAKEERITDLEARLAALERVVLSDQRPAKH